MRSFLQQPYPFSEDAGKKLMVCGGIGVFITLFLILFKPFGFAELPPGLQWKHALLFGGVTFLISSAFQVIPPIFFPSLFKEEEWRSWKEIVYLLITTCFIGAGNYGVIRQLYPQNPGFTGFLKAELITLQVGIFPILFVVFMKQMKLYKKFATDAKNVTEDIRTTDEDKTTPSAQTHPAIVLRGENQNEELSVLADKLFFISSADNYVAAMFSENDEQRSVLLRSSLKKIEEQVAGHSYFFRCHRMYIVNLNLVVAVSGNAQGLKLHLPGCDEAIPVSRSLTETIKDKLHHLSHSPQQT